MTSDSYHSGIQGLIFGDLRGARVVGMGSDIWDLACTVAPAMGSDGWFLGVHNSSEAIGEARRRGGVGNGSGPRVEFQEVDTDLRMSTVLADTLIREHSPSTFESFRNLERELARLRAEQPLVADESVDLVVATGLRDLDSPESRALMLKEFHRIVRRGGRLIVLDVVSDENISTDVLLARGEHEGELGRTVVPESDLLDSLAQAGFYGVTLLRREALPWKIVERVELRRVAIVAHKGKEGPCWEHFQAVMYRGPFKSVEDDDGHAYPRGRQIAVCQKTFDILSREPYRGQFEYTDPLIAIGPQMQKPFPCNLTNPLRDPQQLKFKFAALLRAQPAAQPAPQKLTASTALDAHDGGEGKHRKQVVIFERPSPERLSPLQELAEILPERVGEELDFRIVNPAEDDAGVPAQLRFRMSLSGDECLPAIVVDGVLVAIGSLPERDEIAKLIVKGRPFGTLPFANLRSLAARVGECCGGDSCC